MNVNNDIHHPWAKAIAALSGVAMLDWLTTAGKVCAALYAILVLGEWVYKRLVKRRKP